MHKKAQTAEAEMCCVWEAAGLRHVPSAGIGKKSYITLPTESTPHSNILSLCKIHFNVPAYLFFT